MPCIYILESLLTKKHYVGSSREDNPNSRLQAHNSGKTKSTKSGRPWVLIHFENYPNYTEARKRELFLKTGQGRKFIMERWPSGLR